MLKKVFTYSFFSLFVLFAQANVEPTDSIYMLISQSTSDSVKAKNYDALANLYYKNDSKKAILYADSAIYFSKKAKSKIIEANAYMRKGLAYRFQGNLSKALSLYQKAALIYKEINEDKNLAGAYSNMSVVYWQNKNYKIAKEHLNYAVEVFEKLNDAKGLMSSYTNLGILEAIEKDYEMSEHCFNKAAENAIQIDNYSGAANAYNNLAQLFVEQNKLKKAEKYALKAFNIRDSISDFYGVASSSLMIGNIHKSKNEFIKAKNLFENAIQIAEEKGFLEILSSASYDLSNLYLEHFSNEGQALHFYKLYTKSKDSIFNEAKSKELGKLEAQFEYEKQQVIKEAEHEAELEKQQAVAAQKRRQQNTVITAISSGLALVILFSVFIFNRFRITRRQKNIIQKQKSEVERQKHLVEEKNTEILDSINYAKRLQDAILPSKTSLNENLKDGFIFFKPKDVVSGDFYFMDVIEEKNKKLVYYVAADCTGHGVPGAMVSIVGANGLKRCIQEFGLRDPGKILDKLAELVAANFAQSEEQIRDGMDLALCCLEMENDKAVKVYYAGANNPLWVINPNRKKYPENAIPFRLGGGFEIKANKQAIGYTENITPFDSHTVELESGDTLYTFSDGYPDQFGGETGKKYKSVNFKKLLLSIYDKNMDEQKTLINKEFDEWKGNLEQLDDVCIVGVRLRDIHE